LQWSDIVILFFIEQAIFFLLFLSDFSKNMFCFVKKKAIEKW